MRSLLDCLRLARAARKRAPDQARAHLAEAEALVEDAGEWIDVAAGWAQLGPAGHADARRCLGRALALRGDDVRVLRNAADCQARELGDREAARALLSRAAAGPLAIGDACYLARSWCHLLGDRGEARAVLERARAATAAPTVGELCELAAIHGPALDDRDLARALIAQAEATLVASDDDGSGAWSLANAYRHTLADPAASRRVLDEALARATTTDVCLRIARAAASHDDEPDRRRFTHACVARAASLAGDAATWLACAAAWHEHRGPRPELRGCLDAALACAGDDAAVRAAIAHGHRHWLDDAATADALAARGVAPAALFVRRRTLAGWDPDPAALLDWLRPRLTDAARRDLAAADWGTDAARHLDAIVDLQVSGLVPQPLAWHPREVLELRRWSRGDRVDHVQRAFACTVLLIDLAGPLYRDGHEQTLAILVESCLALGDDALAGAIALQVALIETLEDHRVELPFAYLGLLIAAATRDPRDPRLPALADALIAAAATASGYGADVPRPGWLLDLTRFDARHALWRQLAERHLGAPAAADPALAHLGAIAARLRD